MRVILGIWCERHHSTRLKDAFRVGQNQKTPRGAGVPSPESVRDSTPSLPYRRWPRQKHAFVRCIRRRDFQHLGPPLAAVSGALADAESIERGFIEVPGGTQALGVLERAQRLAGLWPHAAVNRSRIEADGL
jgi:hypothetical protein